MVPAITEQHVMSRCDDLVGFADGELDPERAAAFRAHLPTCHSCQTCLVEALQLTARLGELTLRPRAAARR
jgi:anti-sigma factor RsiW